MDEFAPTKTTWWDESNKIHIDYFLLNNYDYIELLRFPVNSNYHFNYIYTHIITHYLTLFIY